MYHTRSIQICNDKNKLLFTYMWVFILYILLLYFFFLFFFFFCPKFSVRIIALFYQCLQIQLYLYTACLFVLFLGKLCVMFCHA